MTINFLLSIITFILSMNFTFYYLDGFKVSEHKYIRFSQILSPLLIILFVASYVYDAHNMILFLEGDKNTNNTINVGGTVEVQKDAMEVLARNIGFAGTTAGIAGGVGKAISKSSLPPMQKAGIVVASGAMGAGIYLVGSNINKAVNSNNTGNYISSSSNSGLGPAKLLGDSASTSQNSELMNVILGLDMITYACLYLIVILFMIILFKFYFKEDSIKFDISAFVGERFNKNLNYYTIKLIQLNKKTSTVYIFIIFALLFIGLAFEGYFITQLYNNLDKFVDLHINSR